MRNAILPFLAMVFFAQCGSTPTQATATDKPWKSRDEKLLFMFQMANHIIAPIESSCIDEATARLRSKDSTPASPRCKAALSSCGSCHLPKVGGGTYRITLKDKGSFTGKVIDDSDKIRFQAENGQTSEVAANEISKSEFVRGDTLDTAHWSFKKLGGKGRIVKKMFALSAKHGVGCTNCHQERGNFKLNANGKLFDETGEVKKIVLLEDFLRK